MKKVCSFLQIAMICLILTVIIGVNGCPQQGGKETGTGGLSVKFVENAPPVNVVVDQNFPIYAEVENLGDSFVNPGSAKFYLTRLGQNIQNVKTTTLQNKNLLGSGAQEKLEFAAAAKSTLELVEPLTTTMLLTSCYKYGGKAQAEICLIMSNQSAICGINDAKITYNSAEPIQISDISEAIIGNRLQISFTVSNKGKGIVYLPDTDCDKLQAKESDATEFLKSGQIKIRIGDLGGGFSCKLKSLDSSYNQIEALEGAAPLGKITCEKSLAGIEEQKTALLINMDYVYVETISQNILISPS